MEYPFHQTRDVMANPRVDLRDGPRAIPKVNPRICHDIPSLMEGVSFYHKIELLYVSRLLK